MKWFKNIINGSEYVLGCEISGSGMNDLNFDGVLLKKSGNNVFIERAFSGTKENFIAEFTKQNKAATVAIICSGRIVLSKVIESVALKANNRLVQSVLPNANAADFLVQSSREEEHTLVFIIRKQIIDGIVDEWATKNLFVNYITLIRPESPNMSTDQLLPEYHSAFRTAIESLSGKSPVESEAISAMNDTWMWKLKTRKLIRKSVIVTLILLLVNFGVNIFLQSSVTQMKSDAGELRMKISDISRMKEQIEIKKKILLTAGLSNASRTSYFVDKVIGTVPVSIRLTELNFQPLKIVRDDSEDKWTFRNNYLMLSGNSNDEISLNKWLNELRRSKEIHDINLVSYSQEEESGNGVFKIELYI